MIIWGLISALISYFLSSFLLGFAKRKKIALAKPRERDVHKEAVPRLGGLAIVVTFLVVTTLLASFAPDKYRDLGFPFEVLGVSIDKRLLGIIISVVILGAVMLRDDLKGVKPFYKLLAQVFAALVLIGAGVGITYLNNPFGDAFRLDTIAIPVQIATATYRLVLFADLFFILWVVLLTNATNFIDGIDGLASTLCIISGAVMTGLSLEMGQYATATLSTVFIGAIIGFLPFNLPYRKQGARMFIGDTGSQFMGLMLAILTVISGAKLATVLLVFGIVILDAIYVIAKRLYRGKNPFTTPDKSHLHHRFLEAGFSKTATLLIISTISAAFGFLALALDGRAKIIMIGVLAIISLFIFVLLDLKIRGKSSQ